MAEMTSHIDQLLHIARRISSGDIPPYQHNECFTSGAFDLLLVHFQGAEAFDLLAELLTRQSNRFIKLHIGFLCV